MTMHERMRTIRSSHEAGISLVEVLIAIIMLAIIATASLYLSIRSNTTSAYQQHNQVAVTLANQALENVMATPMRKDANGVLLIVDGRGQTAVNNARTAYSTEPGVATMYNTWDTATGTPAAGVGNIPVTQSPSATLNGTQYSTAVLIGTCYRPADMAVNGSECGLVSGYTNPASPPPATATVLTTVVPTIRVVVVVKWTSDDECPSGCTYQSSTLLDMGGDLTWKI